MRAEAFEEEGVTAGVEGRTKIREGGSDLGSLGDIHDVARDEKSEAHPEARARCDREGRSGKAVDAAEQWRNNPVEVTERVIRRRRDVRDVAARAEGATLTTQDDRSNSLGLRTIERGAEVGERLLVERVEFARIVQHDLCDAFGNREVDDHFESCFLYW